MAKFVPDIKTQRWVIVSPVRMGKPDEHKDKKKLSKCPFCYGGESLTPPEVFRVGEGEKDREGWQVRVVPNKFPITDIHEVIIHSPHHEKDIEKLHIDYVIRLLKVYRARFQFHQKDGQVMIFCNHGKHAGASLAHPHSQLVVIPRQINLDTLVKEPTMNVVEDNDSFITYCPDFSQWPYEVWIATKRKNTNFGDIEDKELEKLAEILQRTLKRLDKKHSEPEVEKIHGKAPFAYNFYIHHDQNWFIRIIPRLVHRAGFELGTGLSVNIIDPIMAAKELQSMKI